MWSFYNANTTLIKYGIALQKKSSTADSTLLLKSYLAILHFWNTSQSVNELKYLKMKIYRN